MVDSTRGAWLGIGGRVHLLRVQHTKTGPRYRVASPAVRICASYTLAEAELVFLVRVSRDTFLGTRRATIALNKRFRKAPYIYLVLRQL